MPSLTFTRVTQTHDAETGQVTPVRATRDGAAIAIMGDELFRAFGLITENQVGLQVTTAPGVDRPRVGDTFPWGTNEAAVAETYTVKSVKPFSLNGVDTIASYVLGEK